MEGLDFDMVTALLACAGEATLCYAMMQVGLLVDGFKDEVGLPVPSISPGPHARGNRESRGLPAAAHLRRPLRLAVVQQRGPRR